MKGETRAITAAETGRSGSSGKEIVPLNVQPRQPSPVFRGEIAKPEKKPLLRTAANTPAFAPRGPHLERPLIRTAANTPAFAPRGPHPLRYCDAYDISYTTLLPEGFGTKKRRKQIDEPTGSILGALGAGLLDAVLFPLTSGKMKTPENPSLSSKATLRANRTPSRHNGARTVSEKTSVAKGKDPIPAGLRRSTDSAKPTRHALGAANRAAAIPRALSSIPSPEATKAIAPTRVIPPSRAIEGSKPSFFSGLSDKGKVPIRVTSLHVKN